MNHKSLLLTLAAAAMLLLAACTPKPSNPVESNELPPMYPVYTDVWIPYNIVPLNFLLRGDYEAVEVKATCGGETLTVGVPADRCPVFYRDADTGEIVGIGVDLMRAAAKEAGYGVSFRTIEESTLKDALDNPDYDVVMPFGSAVASAGALPFASSVIVTYPLPLGSPGSAFRFASATV